MSLSRMKDWARRLRDTGDEAANTAEVERLKASWEGLGRHDPLWAIVSVPDKRGNRWDVREFFANGAIELRHVDNALRRAGITLPGGRALDFGAGVGRLTQALAASFDQVDGLDISAPMVEQARAYNRHGERVRYHVSASSRLPFAGGTFDLVFSKIVLQHVGAALQRSYVHEFFRVVRAGGLVVFQTITGTVAAEGTHFESAVATPDGTCTIDMNVFPSGEVSRAIRAAGGRLLHSFEDQSAGAAFESRFFVGTR